MSTKQRIRLNQEKLEKIVFDFLQANYPDFKLKEASLETRMEGSNVTSWWITCEHADGNESIMEDDQVRLLIQEQQGWSRITEHHCKDTEQNGFVLEIEGQ